MKPFFKIYFLPLCVIAFSFCNQHPGDKKNSYTDTLIPVNPATSKYDSTVFEEAFKKLQSGDTLSTATIESFASNIETRADFYELLRETGRPEIFPKQYYNFEKAGESILTNWLLYPTELDTLPSKIELLKKVAYKENDTSFIYYVYRFITDPPHWSSKDGWMIGTVGPYFNDSKPYDWAAGTFSRLLKLNEATAEQEAEWVHKNIYRKSPDK